jgi:hypothetical protein
VNCRGVDALFLELFDESVGPTLGATEDQRLIE